MIRHIKNGDNTLCGKDRAYITDVNAPGELGTWFSNVTCTGCRNKYLKNFYEGSGFELVEDKECGLGMKCFNVHKDGVMIARVIKDRGGKTPNWITTAYSVDGSDCSERVNLYNYTKYDALKSVIENISKYPLDETFVEERAAQARLVERDRAAQRELGDDMVMERDALVEMLNDQSLTNLQVAAIQRAIGMFNGHYLVMAKDLPK